MQSRTNEVPHPRSASCQAPLNWALRGGPQPSPERDERELPKPRRTKSLKVSQSLSRCGRSPWQPRPSLHLHTRGRSAAVVGQWWARRVICVSGVAWAIRRSTLRAQRINPTTLVVAQQQATGLEGSLSLSLSPPTLTVCRGGRGAEGGPGAPWTVHPTQAPDLLEGIGPGIGHF